MALQETGVIAVVKNLSSFMSGMGSINKAIGDVGKGAGNIGSNFVGLGNSVLKLGAIAGGVALTGVAALTGGFLLMGKTALDEFTKYERLSASLEALTARQIAQGTVVEKQRQAIANLTKDESEELDDLNDKIQTETADRTILAARIQEQKERIRQLTDQYGENGLVVIKERAELDKMQLSLQQTDKAMADYQGRIGELNAKNGQLITVTEKVREGQMSMTEAMKLAGPQAKDLLQWTERLAILSPFDQEGVAAAFKTALAYGFTTDQAKRLTEAEIDFASATGQSVDAMNHIALALGQVQAKGKVSGQEIIQLTNAGVGVNKILEDMGFTLDDVSNGLVDTDDFIEAVIKDMEVFEGEAERQSTTFSGLINSLKDLKNIRLREFFTGTFKAIQPHLASFVNLLMSEGMADNIRSWGDALGNFVGRGIGQLAKFIGRLQALSTIFKVGGLFGTAEGGQGLLQALGLSPKQVVQVKTTLDEIKKAISAFQEVGLFDAAAGRGVMRGGLLTVLGISPETQELIKTFADAGKRLFDDFIVKLQNMDWSKIQGGIIGIGVALTSSAIVASITKVVGLIMSLASPIGLVLTLSALLGTAWQENWGGIQEKTQVVVDLLNQKLMPILDAFKEGGFSAGIQELGKSISEFFNGLSGQDGAMPSFDLSKIFSAENVESTLTTLTTSIATFLIEQWPTIQETLNTWRDNFWTWVTGEGGLVSQITTNLATLTQGFRDWANSPETTEAISSIGTSIGTFIVDSLKNVFSDQEKTLPVVDSLLTALTEAFAGITASLIKVGGELVANIIAGMIEGWTESDIDVWSFKQLKEYGEFLGTIDWAEVGRGLLSKLITGITEKITEIGTIFSGIGTNAKTILEKVDLADMGKDLIKSLITGLEKNAGKVLTFLVGLAKDSIKSLMGEWAMGSPSQVMVDIGAELTRSLAQGAADEAKEGEAKLFEAFTTMIQKPLKELKSLGADRYLDIKGLIMGRMPELTAMLKAGTLNATTLRQRVHEIGKEMGFPPGAIDEYVDWNEAVKDVTKAFEKAKAAVLDVKGAMSVADIASQFAQFGQVVISRWTDPLQKSIDLLQEFVDKQNEAAEALANASEKIRENSDEIAENNLKVRELNISKEEEKIKIEEQKTKIAELTEKFGANSNEVKKAQLALDKMILKVVKMNSEIFETNQNTSELESEIADLRSVLAEGFDPDKMIKIGDMWVKAGEAQELLNKKLEEQKKLQEEQAKLAKQQADLAFLQSQLSLIDMIKKAGLDPKAIFQGITFGLNASIPDMIAATSNVVNALINQVNQGLQIASPSRVMFEKGQQVMAGLARGISQSQQMVTRAISMPVAALPNMAMAGGGANGGATTISPSINFNGPITISNGMDVATLGQYIKREVAQTIKR